MCQCGGFQFLVISDIWGVSFHAVVVFSLGKNLLFKSVLGHCGRPLLFRFFLNLVLGLSRLPCSGVPAESNQYLHRVLKCQIELILGFGLFVTLPTLFFGTLELATFSIDVYRNETSKLANVSLSFWRRVAIGHKLHSQANLQKKGQKESIFGSKGPAWTYCSRRKNET